MNPLLMAALVFAVLAVAARSDTTYGICGLTACFFVVAGTLLWFAEGWKKR